MKLLIGTNIAHRKYGLKLRPFDSFRSKAEVYNYRKLFHSLGYDCSLLTDDEIQALEYPVYAYEQDKDETFLIEVLDFNCDKVARQ